MACEAPRSTWIHCGSEPSLLAQRVLVLPSTALAGPSDEVSTDELVAVRPCDNRLSVAAPAAYAMTNGVDATSVAVTPMPIIRPEIFTGEPPPGRNKA